MECVELFNNKENINLKWKKNIKFEDKIKYKNSLVENAIRYPLTESINDELKHEIWKKNLNLELITIDNINDVITKYDLATKKLINAEDRKGFCFNEKKISVVYDNDLVTTISTDNDESVFNATFLKEDELELIPIFYTLNYNMYNLFSLNTEGPITFFDNDLEKQTEESIHKKDISECIKKYADKDNNLIKNIINCYYKGTELDESVESLLNLFEGKLDNLVSYRNLYQKEIDVELKKIEEIKNNKVKKIALMQNLEYLQVELQKLNLLDEELKEKKLRRLLKDNKVIFEDCENDKYEDYINSLINDEYMELYISPNEHKENIVMIYNSMSQDVITTYLIAIYYYLIMILISISEHELTSVYEGNLIKKAIFNIDELEDFIEIINKELLINDK